MCEKPGLEPTILFVNGKLISRRSYWLPGVFDIGENLKHQHQRKHPYLYKHFKSGKIIHIRRTVI